MIRFDNVSYQYQDTKETKQLEDIELTIPQGQFLLVTGKSGCGKSTLAQCINGLIPYFHEGEMTGSVWIGKYETTGLSIEEIGEKVGSVFQDPRSQFFTTNTMDEIAFGCQNMSLPREEILKRVEETIRMTEWEFRKRIFPMCSRAFTASISRGQGSRAVPDWDLPSPNGSWKPMVERSR